MKKPNTIFMSLNKPTPPDFTVSEEVYEFLFIEINKPSFQDQTFQYYISDMNKSVMHKGNFHGKKTEILLSRLHNGWYNIHIINDGKMIESILFVKKTGPVL